MTLLDEVLILPRRRIEDHRGWFLKVITGTEAGLPQWTGEVYLTSARPGEVRGNHFHPVAREWFTVVQGEAVLVLADPQSGERREYRLHEESPATVVVPPGVAHAFLNPPESAAGMLLVAYSDRLYDPVDTVPYPLISGSR